MCSWDRSQQLSTMNGFRNRFLCGIAIVILAKKKKEKPISQSSTYLISKEINASIWNLKSQFWKAVQVPEV